MKKLKFSKADFRSHTKMLIIKTSIGLLTAAVIGMIVKEEVKVLDDVEKRYFPEKEEAEESAEETS